LRIIRCNPLTPNVAELVAYGRTTQEIAQHINADAVIFQDLSDLTAACIEAAEGESEIQGFEVGVFSGKYITEVPEGYLEHLSKLRGNREKIGMLIANGKPVNMAACQQMAPEYSEDIK
jgi:amidophosphoribosyltransferase